MITWAARLPSVDETGALWSSSAAMVAIIDAPRPFIHRAIERPTGTFPARKIPCRPDSAHDSDPGSLGGGGLSMKAGYAALVSVWLLLGFAGAESRIHAQSTDSAAKKLTFGGDVALWTVAIKPDKTQAFEQILAKVSAALAGSEDPTRQRQAAGWKVMKIEKPLPDGNIAYVHVISPVIHDADYTVMQILYDAFPDERQALYESYRDAFAANLSLATGPVAVDLAPKPAGAGAQSH
jgi:hypothetical protein